MIKSVKILFITLLLGCNYNSSASGDFSLEWQKVPSAKMKTGSLQNLVLKLTYTGSEQKQLRSTFEVPPQWFSINAQSDYLLLKPEEVYYLYFSYKIKGESTADNYRITVNLFDEKDDLIEKFDFTVTVERSFNLITQTLSQNPYLTAGDTATYEYRLINQGNSKIKLKLKTADSKLLQADTLSLHPGQSQVVSVQLYVPQNQRKNEKRPFLLKIYESQFDTTINIRRNVEIFPNSSYSYDPYERFPINISMNYLGRFSKNLSGSTYQLDILGRGIINDSIGDYLEFHLRGPDRLSYSSFGNYEEYYLKYSRNNWQFNIGDQVIRLSQLTEQNRYVRGITAFYEKDNFRYGVHYGSPRFFPDIKNEFATNVSFTSTNKIFNVEAIALAKQFNATNDSLSFIPSLNVGFHLKNFKLETEYSRSFTKGDNAGAYKLLLNGKVNNLTYSGSYLKAEALYTGYFQNSTIGSLSLNYSWKKTGISISGAYMDANPSLDTFFVNSPLNYSYLGGVYLKTGKSSKIHLLGGQRRRLDRMELAKFDYLENVFRLSYDVVLEKTNINLYTEYGRNQNFLNIADEDITNSYTIGADYNRKLGEKMTFNLNVLYLDNQRYSFGRYRNLNYGGSLSWNPSQQTRLFVSYRNAYDIEEYYRIQDFFVLGYDQKINDKHKFNVTARYTKPQRQVENTFLFISAKYIYRLDFPMRKKKNLGEVSGWVHTSDGISVPDAIIHIDGNRSKTDANGNYSFKALKAGTHYLHIDRSSINVDLIPADPEPIIMEVGQNVKTVRDLKLVKVCSIKGQLIFPAQTNGILDQQNKNSRPVYIKISNGKESYLGEADLQGVFEFKNLRPGTWKVEIIKTTIDPSMQFEKTSGSLEIKEGEQKTIEFKANRKKKKLKMQNTPIKLTAKATKTDSGTD